MNKFIKKLNQDRRLSILLALLFLILAYSLFSLALNSGSYWQYIGGFICLILVVNLIKRAIIRR
jgi:lipopolysaccharide export LptBFGC system permease protein LptF